MKRYNALTIMLAAVLLLGALPATAANVTPEAMYEQLFSADAVKAEWFSKEVLAQLAPAQFDAIVAQYVAALGPYVGAEGAAPNYRLEFENGQAMSQIVLNAQGQIAGIWFGPPEPRGGDFDELLAEFQQLPGEVSVLVAGDAGVLANLNAEQPLAVGSAFKLAIVAALQDMAAAGQLAWSDVITLEAGDMSLPSGLLQDWPEGTPLTVQSLASLMISLSDNTATDALLRHVGKEAIELYAPHNKPFLSTREAFVLKDPANADLLAAYREGDEASRRELLAQTTQLPLPSAHIFAGGTPLALDVEWYFSTAELVNLMAYVAGQPFMSINPGVANPDNWEYAAFKGGSEPGVLNLTTLVTAESGATYVVSATWNNAAEVLDDNQFVILYTQLLSAIKEYDAGL